MLMIQHINHLRATEHYRTINHSLCIVINMYSLCTNLLVSSVMYIQPEKQVCQEPSTSLNDSDTVLEFYYKLHICRTSIISSFFLSLSCLLSLNKNVGVGIPEVLAVGEVLACPSVASGSSTSVGGKTSEDSGQGRFFRMIHKTRDMNTSKTV